MKIEDYRIPHPAGIAAEISAIRARTRQAVAESFELLGNADPDTFLGRQHSAPEPGGAEKPRSDHTGEGTE